MPVRRLFVDARTFLAIVWAVALPGACRGNDAAAHQHPEARTRVDSGTRERPANSDSSWDNSAGPVLLIEGATRDEALVLLPSQADNGAMESLAKLGEAGAKVTLFGRGGERFGAKLGTTPNSDDAQCRLWPLVSGGTDVTRNNWAVGFVGGLVSPLPLDSVDVLTSRDSAALAAEASRLASLVTAPTGSSFQGLRFVAHDIRRFEVSPGVQGIVAHLFRRVNEEADPQEEQTLLVAERDSGVTAGPYQLAYAERAHGLEEQVPTPEVIAAIRLAGRPVLIVARDSDTGVAYAILARTGSRQWRIHWTSSLTRCD